MWKRFAVLLVLAACASEDDPEKSLLDREDVEAPGPEPDHIVVDHILIGVRSQKFAQGRYSRKDARELAYDLKEKLDAGADWIALKREHSEDPPPGGPYPMCNNGVSPRAGETPRRRMVGAFGDVGFKLEVGEIGIADYDPDPRRSPFGFHIIKRVK